MKIGLIRHGMTDWNVERRAQGQTDIPLNETGRKQAQALANRLKDEKWDLIISSHLSRAYETASIIAKTLKIPVLTDKRLQEKSFGNLEGTTINERISTFGPDWHRVDFGEEDNAEVQKRSLQAVEDACLQYSNQNILFVSHGATMKQLIVGLLQDEQFDQGFENTSISIFTGNVEKWECSLLNCAKHLSALKTNSTIQ